MKEGRTQDTVYLVASRECTRLIWIALMETWLVYFEYIYSLLAESDEKIS